MKVTRRCTVFVAIASSFILSAAFTEGTNPVLAQMPQQTGGPGQQMGMIFYPVERGTDGQQYITTRAGYKVAVPGLGIDQNANQIAIFTDPQNHYWYVDKNNNPTPVSAQQMQSVMSQIQGQAMQRGQAQYSQYPQTMPPQGMYPQAAPVAAAAPQQNSNSAGNTAMMSGLAAAGGAAVGSMLTNSMYNNNNQYPSSYNGMPYGQPIYKEPTGQYYYANQSGAHIPVYPPTSTSSMYDQQAAAGYYQQQQQKEQANKAAAAGYYGKQQQQEQANKEAAAGYYGKQQQQTSQGQNATKAESDQKQGKFGRRHKGEDSAQVNGAAQQATNSARTVQPNTSEGGKRRRFPQQLDR